MEQGSAEWFAIRCGRVTASRVADVIAKTKTGWGASRANYMAELVAERLTGVPAQGFTNAAMQHGTATEPAAREAYRAQTFDEVDQVGFVPHPFIEFSGASPDGLVGADGMLEIKCPNTATHIETLLGGAIPAKYETQMLWQVACAGREWCDFVSFDPRLPPEMQLFVKRLERDDKRIAELEEMVSDFLAELDEKVAKLTALYRKEAA
jgi:putative phage-type endonuclease